MIDWKWVLHNEVVVSAQGFLAFFIWQLLKYKGALQDAFVSSLQWLVVFLMVLNVIYFFQWLRRRFSRRK